MSKINLLPWREEQRKARNLSFYAVLGVVAGACLGVVILSDLYFSHRISVETANLDYINTKLKDIKSEVSEVQALKQDKNQLSTRIHIIQSLEVDRTSIVKLLDTIPKILPENIYLTKLFRTEARIESNSGNNEETATNANLKQNKAPKTEVSSVIQKSYSVEMTGVSLTNGSISVLLKNLGAVNWVNDLKLNEVSINKEASGLNFKISFTQMVMPRAEL